MDKNWFTPRTWMVTLSAATVLMIVASILISRSYIAHRAIDVDESKRAQDCRSQFLNGMKPAPRVIDVKLIEHINADCHQQIAAEDTLTDFGIRKSAFLNQQVETRVLLWLVVAITLSGVVLAGVQLVAAYRLACLGKAAFEQGGQLNIEHNKISLGSSITGLMILGISFGFFLVFVSKVYLIPEEDLLEDHQVAMHTTQRESVVEGPIATLPRGLASSPNATALPRGRQLGLQTVPTQNWLVLSQTPRTSEELPNALADITTLPAQQ